MVSYGSGRATVLEVGASGNTFLRSSWDDPGMCDTWYTIAEAMEKGWVLEGAEDEPLHEEAAMHAAITSRLDEIKELLKVKK